MGLRIDIIDTGVGLSRKNKYTLLNNQKDNNLRELEITTNAIEGSGIGLSIVKEILETHHRYFFITSNVNKGTNTFFTL
jgi:two-component system sensor histidine kinase NblS